MDQRLPGRVDLDLDLYFREGIVVRGASCCFGSCCYSWFVG